MISFPPILLTESEHKWQRFCEVASPETLTLLEKRELETETRHIFVFSDYIFESCIRAPLLLKDLIETEDLFRQYHPEDYPEKVQSAIAETKSDTELGNALCRLRRREMVRIAWRDLSGNAQLWETLSDLSTFATTVLQGALEMISAAMYERYGIPKSKAGTPQELVVIGMGKLGAGELNYSSDVDLVFAYPQYGTAGTGDRAITNEEFFMRLCRRYISVLGNTAPEGPLFRVDLRLRPFGENGPLVMTFDNMEEYYQNHGREWERYAWIKARVVAGDKVAGATLLNRMRPFIYRRYIDFNMFESFRDMKRKIEQELRIKGIRENIKNGPGGIREIEFFGQIFQLLRGGVTASLQRRAIMTVMEILAREDHIPEETASNLRSAYEFLRNTENRLQEYRDQQTHILPAADTNRLRLALSMGFYDWERFSQALNRHRSFVHDQFRQLLSMEEETSQEEKKNDTTPAPDTISMLESIWQESTPEEEAVACMANLGIQCPTDALKCLTALREDPHTMALGQEGRRRLNKLMPILLEKFCRTGYPLHVLQAVLNLVKTVQRRTTYLSLLLENPKAITRLLALSAASPWVISYLTRHPVLLDELLDPRTLFTPPTRAELSRDLSCRFDSIQADDLEYQMESLRVFKHANTLRVAAADISGALPLMRVSDHLSWIAEEVVSRVLDLSWQHLTEKHGVPTCDLSGESLQRGFAVIAYGKLGGFELGYTSDLDVVFLHAGVRSGSTDGERPLDNGQFYARLGQRVIHLMTAHTAAGILYETDVRLRPSGASGMLVSHIDAFEAYQENEAWTWEHQALVRARAIWGDPALCNRFEEIRARILRMKRDKCKLQEEVRDMRHRMYKELHRNEPGTFHLKQGRGGMVDIEFLVQYIVLLMAEEHAPLARWTDNVRLIQSLGQCGLINDKTAHLLRTAYLSYRSRAHRMGLQDRPAVVPEEIFASMRQNVMELWRRVFGSL